MSGINIITMTVTDRPVIASCLLGSRIGGTGVSRVVPGGIERLGGNGRPTQAPAVAAAAQAHAYASTCAANGAGEGRQKKQHLTMWAFRGLEPWRDPA
jgi:hypothetical protein